ncbi:hypothetical protein BDP27DRAFT_1425939 [Rhodocollybia butyracea]|uniref:Uncharacterized protein n=1 Tax=Rhodocollybia butyracea TaxID=206335 RepID=A0A9P5PEU4_9AGAR|nr:hypothetical protein BDP27DRAFT_1425939 [Rhodocollybia butyracea]
MVMKRLGWMSSLMGIIPEEKMINEKELFCTENHEHNYNWVIYDSPTTKATGKPVEFSLQPGDTEVLIASFPCHIRLKIVFGYGSIIQIVFVEVLFDNIPNCIINTYVKNCGFRMINEKELFCTENHECNYNWVNAESLIQICHVIAAEYCSIGIENWILHSPDHFYVRYCFLSLNVKTWDSKRCITRKEKTTLRALDVFGECGAFGLALAEGSSSFDITHAIEIAPSAVQTYKLNSPETTVLNICVNDAVRYIIKKNLNKNNLDDTPITSQEGW